MPEIKGDYQGRLKTIKATSDAKLETVSAIEAGSAIIGNIDRVATVGQIDHLGSVGNVNRIDELGTVKNIPYVYDVDYSVYYHSYQQQMGLVTSPGFDGINRQQLRVNSNGYLILHTLGTVERVKEIDNLGTVGKSQTHIEQYGTQVPLQGTAHAAYTVPKADRSGVLYNLRPNRDRDLVTAPGWTGSRRVKLLTDDDWQLKTAPARSRKGVVQTVANAGTAVALVASSTPAIGVIVKAEHENLGTVYVGDSTVDDTHGFKLRRDEFISFSCQNAGSVFIDASRNAQKVSALYINY